MVDSVQQGLYLTRSGEVNLGNGKPPVILLHGLFGMGRNLGAVARALSDQYAVFSFDLPNHGRSPHSDAMTISSMATCYMLLWTFCSLLSGGLWC
jgi:pimeloyl-ACP methyl ester carboxylesterase